MNEEYLIGRITVHFGIDIVSLVHKVNGRFSYMDLVEGDLIEVKEDDQYKAITIKDILNTIERDSSQVWNHGSSIYEGAQVRVKLDPQGNKRAALTEKSLKINKVMFALKQGLITHEEATQAFLVLELDDDE
ncbi:hypothetical protein [Lysinibacillus parviboronicapiens]|uniref:hypothetical protein n=1 Tax=Lysinibacillus parviboronicapiens TaxID=436516 RepID=UPI000D37DB74|nr:hypothetical protein [Lysinibacillus parviboronicapiens]